MACETAASVQITSDDLEAAQDMLDFIELCPSPFHTVAASKSQLDAAGFTYLPEGSRWDIERGGAYYTTRNGSSIIAFKVGEKLARPKRAASSPDAAPYHFQLTASHGDSPTFKIKAEPELKGPESYLRLSAEVYGGAIDYTWFDKPLSVAGRVMVRNGARIESRLLSMDREVAIIPSLAIHMDRSVNQAFSPDRAVDLCPLFSAGALEPGAFKAMIAEELEVEEDQLLSYDLFLVNRQEPCIWGYGNEFYSSPKLDDLACAYTSLMAFLESGNQNDISVWCCFDNEEVGSGTKQGAKSTFLTETVTRINAALGFDGEVVSRALAASMLVSCDNAHALHPNRPEKYDGANHPHLNGGIVIKETANQKYCTDAFSRAAFAAVCDDAGLPRQTFANRSDLIGGSTLGNLLNTHVSIHMVDVGLPQLAMHSSYETGGVADVRLSIEALAAFYNANITISGAESIEIA